MELLEFRQTIFVDKNNLNKVVLKFDSDFNGSKLSVMGASCTVKGSKATLMIPTVTAKTVTEAVVSTPSGITESFTICLEPRAAFDVCVIYTSEEDNNCFSSTFDDFNNSFLKKVYDYAKFFPDFRYTAHSISCLKSSGEDFNILKELVKSENLEINPIPDKLQTHHLSSEELARAFYSVPALKTHIGATPKTVILRKISGFTQSAVGVMASAGIQNVIILPSDFRNSNQAKNLPPVFIMPSADKTTDVTVLVMPEEESRILSGLIPNNPSDTDTESEYLACRILAEKTDFSEIENLIDSLSDRYAHYGTIPLPASKKGASASLMPYIFCTVMNSRWKYPRFTMKTATGAMEFIKQRSTPPIPRIFGELNDHTADIAVAFPMLFAEKNRLSEAYTAIEASATLNAVSGKSFPHKDFRSAMENLIKFCCFNTECNEKQFTDEQLFNFNIEKKYPLKAARAILSDIDFTPPLGKSEHFTTLFNPLLIKRQTNACSDIFGGKNPDYIKELPPLGFAPCQKKEITHPSCFTATENTVTTPFYSISYCNKTGRIFSIISRRDLKELVDSDCSFSIGDFIYAVTDSKEGLICSEDIQKPHDVRVITGKTAIAIKTTGFEEQSRAQITREIIFHRHTKNIDIKLSFTNALSLQGDFSDRFRKNIFTAIPLKIPDAVFLTLGQAGFTDESTGRIPSGVRDFSVTSGCAVVMGEDFGCLITSKDARVLHYGSIQYNCLSGSPRKHTAHVYPYLMSNRLNTCVFNTPDECRGDFHITLHPFKKSEFNSIQNQSRDMLSPFLSFCGHTFPQSKIQSDIPINLTAFKPSEDKTGYILRFTEATGESKQAVLTLPFKIKKAYYTSITEENLIEIKEIDGCTIKLRVGRMSYTTVKLIPFDKNMPAFTEDSDSDILDFFSYKDNFERNIVVWSKKSFKNSCKYDIICDGTVIATADNLPKSTQIYPTGITGNHSFEVKKGAAD